MAHCAVVSNNCTAPAGWGNSLGYAIAPSVRLPKCWQCGESVCTSCSTKVGRSRICLACQWENSRREYAQ